MLSEAGAWERSLLRPDNPKNNPQGNQGKQFYEMSYNDFSKQFQPFKGYSLGNKIMTILQDQGIEEFNQIQFNLYELSKNIHLKLTKANRYQVKVWMIKIHALCQDAENLCRKLEIQFISGLFSKIIHILLSISAVTNDFSHDLNLAKKNNGRRKGQITDEKEVIHFKTKQCICEKLYTHKDQRKRIKQYSKDFKKVVLGGVSLYLESYEKRIERKIFCEDFFSEQNKDEKKVQFLGELQKELKGEKQSEKNIEKELQMSIPFEKSRKLKRSLLYDCQMVSGMKEMELLQYEFRSEQNSTIDCKLNEIIESYQMEKQEKMKILKRFIKQSSEAEKKKRIALETLISKKNNQIEQLKKRLENKLFHSFSMGIQTIDFNDFEESSFQLCKKENGALEKMISNLNIVVKNNNIEKMNLDASNIELKRKVGRLEMRLQQKNEEIERIEMKMKKNLELQSIKNCKNEIKSKNHKGNRKKTLQKQEIQIGCQTIADYGSNSKCQTSKNSQLEYQDVKKNQKKENKIELGKNLVKVKRRKKKQNTIDQKIFKTERDLRQEQKIVTLYQSVVTLEPMLSISSFQEESIQYKFIEKNGKLNLLKKGKKKFMDMIPQIFNLLISNSKNKNVNKERQGSFFTSRRNKKINYLSERKNGKMEQSEKDIPRRDEKRSQEKRVKPLLEDKKNRKFIFTAPSKKNHNSSQKSDSLQKNKQIRVSVNKNSFDYEKQSQTLIKNRFFFQRREKSPNHEEDQGYEERKQKNHNCLWKEKNFTYEKLAFPPEKNKKQMIKNKDKIKKISSEYVRKQNQNKFEDHDQSEEISPFYFQKISYQKRKKSPKQPKLSKQLEIINENLKAEGRRKKKMEGKQKQERSNFFIDKPSCNKKSIEYLIE